MFSLNKHKSNIVGVDIGTTSVKTIELTKSGKSLSLDRYGHALMTPGLINDGQINDADAVAAIVEKALRASDSKAKRAVICVPIDTVISKTISVEKGLRANELESLVEIEIDRLVPYPLEELNIDYFELPPSGRSDGVKLEILACRKSLTEELVSAINFAGLDVAVLDVDVHAIKRSHDLVIKQIVGTAKNQTTAVIQFGFNKSRLVVIQDNQIVYHRDGAFGGRQLVDRIVNKFDMSMEDAMQSLTRNDLPRGFKNEVLKHYVKNLAVEITRAMQFFYSSNAMFAIDQLLLSGGCAGIGNLHKVIESRVEIPTAILNPFKNMEINRKISTAQLSRNVPAFALATGLALRGLSNG